jgi:hypothetical protein
MSDIDIEQKSFEIFEQLEKLISNEERLILRLQGFCEEVLNFEDDCTESEDKEEEILRKASKIADKLFTNILNDTNYNLVSHKIYPVDSKVKFKISKDDNIETFILKVENDGFELEQV